MSEVQTVANVFIPANKLEGKDRKLGGSLAYVDVDTIQVDRTLNIRTTSGQVVSGVELFDNYDINILKDEILKDGRILEPIWVNEVTEDCQEFEKGLYVFRGFRRTISGQSLKADPTTPQGVLENLSKSPVLKFKNLSRLEMLATVNGQNTKRYSRAEIVTYVWNLVRNGLVENQIIPLVFAQMSEWSGHKSRAAATKIQEIEDPKDRLKAQKAALTGVLSQEILYAYRLGEEVQKNFLIHILEGEGQKCLQKKEFLPNRANLAKLWEAKTKDEKMGSTMGVVFGPIFQAVLVKLKLEYSAPKKDKDKSDRPEMKVIDEILDSCKSALARTIGQYVKGLPNGAQVMNQDALVNKMEIGKIHWEEIVGGITKNSFTLDEVKLLVGCILNGERQSIDALVN